jgi:hypothetical protein
VPFHTGFTFQSFKEISWQDKSVSWPEIGSFLSVPFRIVTLPNSVVAKLFMPVDTLTVYGRVAGY